MRVWNPSAFTFHPLYTSSGSEPESEAAPASGGGAEPVEALRVSFLFIISSFKWVGESTVSVGLLYEQTMNRR